MASTKIVLSQRDYLETMATWGSYKKLGSFDKQLDNATPSQIGLPSADNSFKKWEEGYFIFKP